MLQRVDAGLQALSLLTPKERECLRLVGRQRSSKEIARELGISKASVDTYCNRARAKLGVSNRRAAAQLVLDFEAQEATRAAPKRSRWRAAAASPQAVVSVLPPVSSLGPTARIGIVFAGAVMLTLAFGMLLSGLQTLNDFVLAAHARAAAHHAPAAGGS
jgi:DNA-binding CsgD family transcriptional regulator